MDIYDEVWEGLCERLHPFDYDSIRQKVPTGYWGVYAIWVLSPDGTNMLCAYIGSSTEERDGVRRRLLDHERCADNPVLRRILKIAQIKKFSVVRLPDEYPEFIEDAEAELIQRKKPLANYQHNLDD